MNSNFSPTLIIEQVLGPLDWFIFIFILVLTFGSVIYGQLKKRGALNQKEHFLDLLLMGRRLTLPLFVATLVATWYGGIFGVTRIAFESGIFNFITQGVFWYASYLIFAFFMVHKMAPYQALTMPDLIHKMFGPRSSKLSAVFNFFNVLPIAYLISLGLFTQSLFGGDLFIHMLIGLIVVLSYSSFGGLRAVVYSDLIQFFVMCFSVAMVLAFSFSTFGGLEFLKTELPQNYFHLTGQHGYSATLVWGLIALSTLVDPNFYQRCFAAQKPSTAKKGIVISTVIWCCFDICTTLGAMYARATIPEADSAQGYLIYSLQLLPDGLRGLFLAGLLATILSTLDSYLFLAGTTLAYDLAPRKWRGRPWVHHLGVLSVGFLALALAELFDGNIKLVWKVLGSYFTACLLLPVVAGHLFSQRISDRGFVFSALLAAMAVTVWQLAPLPSLLSEWEPLYVGLVTSALGLFFSSIFLRSA